MREAEEKKQREQEEKLRRLEEAEKKRQLMLQAQKVHNTFLEKFQDKLELPSKFTHHLMKLCTGR